MDDAMFHALFASKGSEKILKILLNAIFRNAGDPEVTELTIMNPMSTRKYYIEKDVVLDIKAKDVSGSLINIEVQLSATDAFRKRLVYYNSKMVSSQLVKGDDYSKLKRAITIAIVADNELLRNGKKVHTIYRLRDETGDILVDTTEIQIIELKKYDPEKKRGEMTDFEKWLFFLKFGEEIAKDITILPEEMKEEEGILMALQKYKEITAKEKFIMMIEDREKAERDRLMWKNEMLRIGREEGREKGREEGRKEGREEGREEGIEKGKKIGWAEAKIEAGLSVFKETQNIELAAKIAGLSIDAFSKKIQKIV